MNSVIVDTSAWIESFRAEGDGELKKVVKRLIIGGGILIPGIVKAEILRGARSKKEYEMLGELLRGLTHLSVADDFWERLSRFSFGLFRKGITVPLADTYIALLAIENNVPLLHCDAHFDLIAQKTRLEVLRVS